MTYTLAEVVGRPVSRETTDKLKLYEAMVREESNRQNLVSKATLDNFWTRHVLDSAQLIKLAANEGGTWVDIGSGAGLPGIVLSCLTNQPITLVEPRRLRAEFLQRVVDRLELPATVAFSRAERVEGEFAVITARAVASLDKLLQISSHLSTGNTLHLYPKGKNAESELFHVRQTWQGLFHVERSLTDVDSYIIVAREVRPRIR